MKPISKWQVMLPIYLAKRLLRFARYRNERKIENSTATFRISKFIKIIFNFFQSSGLADSPDNKKGSGLTRFHYR